MSSWLRRAYDDLVAAGRAGSSGSIEKRVVDGLRQIGTFAGATVGPLSGRGRPLKQLLAAMSPAPQRRGSYVNQLVDGGGRQFRAAVLAAIASQGGGGGLQPPPGGDPVPDWLDDLDQPAIDGGGGGVSFADGEAYINGQLITDLSQIFTGYEPSRKTVEGYDFGEVDTEHFLEWEVDLLALVASMDFAFRVEFRLKNGFGNLGIASFGDQALTFGADAYMFGSSGDDALQVLDWSGVGTPSGVPILHNTWYTLASSNNPEGWRTSVNGAASVLDDTQTVGTCDRVTIGAAANDAMFFPGTIRKLTFRPNGMNDAALRAWSSA